MVNNSIYYNLEDRTLYYKKGSEFTPITLDWSASEEVINTLIPFIEEATKVDTKLNKDSDKPISNSAVAEAISSLYNVLFPCPKIVHTYSGAENEPIYAYKLVTNIPAGTYQINALADDGIDVCVWVGETGDEFKYEGGGDVYSINTEFEVKSLSDIYVVLYDEYNTVEYINGSGYEQDYSPTPGTKIIQDIQLIIGGSNIATYNMTKSTVSLTQEQFDQIAETIDKTNTMEEQLIGMSESINSVNQAVLTYQETVNRLIESQNSILSLLTANSQTSQAIQTTISDMQQDLAQTNNDVLALTTSVSDITTSLSNINQTIDAVQSSIQETKSTIDELKSKTEWVAELDKEGLLNTWKPETATAQ